MDGLICPGLSARTIPSGGFGLPLYSFGSVSPPLVSDHDGRQPVWLGEGALDQVWLRISGHWKRLGCLSMAEAMGDWAVSRSMDGSFLRAAIQNAILQSHWGDVSISMTERRVTVALEALRILQ